MEIPSIKYIDYRNRTFVGTLQRSEVDIPWINIVLSGSLEYIINDQQILIPENHVGYFAPGVMLFRQEQNTTVRYLSLRYTENIPKRMLDTVVPLVGERQQELVWMLQSYYFGMELGEDINKEAANLILGLLLAELENNCRHTDPKKRIIQIRNFVMQNFMNDIHNTDVAKALFLHPSYCNTLYKKYTGETIGDLIDRVRLEHAKTKLAYSSISIREIAGECGIHDVYYFSRWFTSQAGVSPTEYRKNFSKATSQQI